MSLTHIERIPVREPLEMPCYVEMTTFMPYLPLDGSTTLGHRILLHYLTGNVSPRPWLMPLWQVHEYGRWLDLDCQDGYGNNRGYGTLNWMHRVDSRPPMHSPTMVGKYEQHAESMISYPALRWCTYPCSWHFHMVSSTSHSPKTMVLPLCTPKTKRSIVHLPCKLQLFPVS